MASIVHRCRPSSFVVGVVLASVVVRRLPSSPVVRRLLFSVRFTHGIKKEVMTPPASVVRRSRLFGRVYAKCDKVMTPLAYADDFGLFLIIGIVFIGRGTRFTLLLVVSLHGLY